MDALEAAIARLLALKAEHRPIVLQLARDAGMTPESRSLLLTHLLEEEDERAAEIAALAGVSAAAPEPSSSAATGTESDPTRGGLRWTVGPLRAAGNASPSSSVGSLRRT